MDETTKYWINQVAVKLNKLQLNGVDFNDYHWIFSWDDDLGVEENLKNVAAEDNALTVLTRMEVVKSVQKENFYRSQQQEAFDDPMRGHVIWGDWDSFHPAKREYQYLRIIDGLDYAKLIEFCAKHGINYEEKRVEATLEIIDQIPSVSTVDNKYYLKALKVGTALDIVEAAKTHFDERLSKEGLRLLMGKPHAFSNQKNIKQIFRSTNVFGEGNVLHPFVEVSSDSFMLKKSVNLTAQQLSVIQKASTN